MADTVQFDLVSPERLLASVEATEVKIPGAMGDLTAMPMHAPLITTLRPGIVTVSGSDGTQSYVVTGGFAEINAESISVLAERAIPRADMTQELLDEMIAEAASVHKSAKEAKEPDSNAVDDAVKLVADMVAMGGEIGLSSQQPSL